MILGLGPPWMPPTDVRTRGSLLSSFGSLLNRDHTVLPLFLEFPNKHDDSTNHASGIPP